MFLFLRTRGDREDHKRICFNDKTPDALSEELEARCPTKVEKGTDLIHRGKHGSEGEGTYLKPTDRQRQQELTCTEAKDTETKTRQRDKKHKENEA